MNPGDVVFKCVGGRENEWSFWKGKVVELPDGRIGVAIRPSDYSEHRMNPDHYDIEVDRDNCKFLSQWKLSKEEAVSVVRDYIVAKHMEELSALEAVLKVS